MGQKVALPSGQESTTDIQVCRITTRLAVSEPDRRAAYRLRYEVYVTEQGKSYSEANHEERILADHLDKDCSLLIAESDGAVIGTVRTNSLADEKVQNQYRYLDFHSVPLVEPKASVVSSRLATERDHRNLGIRSKLFESLYEHHITRGTRHCFLVCAPPIVRIFRRYGFREYNTPIMDEVVGRLHRMVLELTDIGYLRSIASPFAPIAARHL